MEAEEIFMTEAEYEEILNDSYGDVSVCGITYPAGTTWKEIDPTAFRCALADQPSRWKCSDCKEIYDSEEEAEDCCKEDEEAN